MRRFNLKGEWLVAHSPNDEVAPGRTIYPEPMHMAEPGWSRAIGGGASTWRGARAMSRMRS